MANPQAKARAATTLMLQGAAAARGAIARATAAVLRARRTRVLRQRFLQQLLVSRHLHRLQNQRRVGGRVLRLKTADLLEVAGIGHHGGELL
jgi:hypothetical protein